MSGINKMSLDISGGSAEYFIKNKDRVLGVFEWSDSGFVTLRKDFGLPSFVRNDVDGWLGTRTPPKHREHMEELLKSCGLTDTKSVLDYSKGLSLTDTLWVTSDASLKWKDVNLFENKFDETIARIAFEGGFQGLKFSMTSPEFGTDGALPKCWIRNSDNEVVLVKGGTEGFSNTGKEPLSEVLAHQVLDRLEYPHVPYTLGKYRGKRVSMCKLMTSQNTMLIPIYKYYSHFFQITSILGDCKRDGILDKLAQLMIFDYLSWNTDRHAGNLGVLLDADTFELKDFAPLWDHGCSMLCYYNGTDDLDEYITHSGPALYDSFESGAKYGKGVLGNKHNVSRLIDFEFDLSQIGDYPVEHVIKVQDWLQGRVNKFLEM